MPTDSVFSGEKALHEPNVNKTKPSEKDSSMSTSTENATKSPNMDEENAYLLPGSVENEIRSSCSAQATQDSALAHPSREEAEAAVRTLLLWAGDNPNREGLVDTPSRVVKAYSQIFRGYGADDKDLFENNFEDADDQPAIVLIRNVKFYSYCEHYMLPIIGIAHIAYYPVKGVVSRPKLASLIDTLCRRLQTQESMAIRIADVIESALSPRGVAVLVEATHLSVDMLSVQSTNTSSVALEFRGSFTENISDQVKFLMMLK